VLFICFFCLSVHGFLVTIVDIRRIGLTEHKEPAVACRSWCSKTVHKVQHGHKAARYKRHVYHNAITGNGTRPQR